MYGIHIDVAPMRWYRCLGPAGSNIWRIQQLLVGTAGLQEGDPRAGRQCPVP